MSNTKILSTEFDYWQPGTVDEALQLLSQYRHESQVLAGGTDLLVQMKLGRISPRVVVNVCHIPAINQIEERGGGLTIGAATHVREIERSAIAHRRYSALAEAASQVGSVQIRNMATIGGNMCNASPAADLPPTLLALGATVTIAGRDGERTLPIDEFFLGHRHIAAGADELLVRIDLPAPAPGLGSAFFKIARVACDVAKVNAAAAIEREDGHIRDCRIALGSISTTAIRSRRAEEVLIGQPYSPERVLQAAEEASLEVQVSRRSRMGRSTPEYRRTAVKSLVKDALEMAWQRAAVNGGNE